VFYPLKLATEPIEGAERDKANAISSAGTLGIFLEKDFEELFDRFILEVLLELEDSYYPIFALSAP
jgi:hypothetical protein